MLHPDFRRIFDALYESGFELDVCTNGTLLDSSDIYYFRDKLSEISISIDDYENIRHDRMRGVEGAFEQTMKNVRCLIESDIEVHATTVVDNLFAEKIIPMTNFLYNEGIRSVSYLGLIPIGTGENLLFSENIQKVLEEQVDYVRKKYVDMQINTKHLLMRKSFYQCKAGSVVYGLGVDGLTLCPCLLTREREGKSIGDERVGMCPGSRYLTQRRE